MESAKLPSSAKKNIFFVLKWLIIGGVFFYIGVLVFQNYSQVEESFRTLNTSFLLLSIPIGVFYLIYRSIIWHLIVRSVVGEFPVHMDMLTWLCTNVGKYVPGKVFWLLGLVHFYRKKGIPAEKVALCFLIETCCTVLSAAAIFAVALVGTQSEEGSSLLGSLALPLALVLVASHPCVFRFFLDLYCRLFKRPKFEFELKWLQIWLWSALMVGAWFVLGVGFYFLVKSLAHVELSFLVYLTGSLAIAGVIGTLALFAPSGVGVREGILTATLGLVIPIGISATVVIFCRLWMTLADLICAGFAVLVIRWWDIGVEEK